MNSKTRILVGLDLSSADKYIIRFLVNNLKVFGHVEKLYFIHVEKNLERPEEPKLPSSDLPRDEVLLNKINEVVMGNRYPRINSSDILTVEGNPLEAILHRADIKKVNLLVLGRKPVQDGSGIIAEQLARKSNASVLFIPSKEEMHVRNIFVPLDFSEHSKLALERALEIAEQDSDSTVSCRYVYDVLPGYNKTGKTFEQAAEIMKRQADKKLKTFLKAFKSGNKIINADVVLASEEGIAKTIYSEAKKTNADLIAMGSKGQTFASWILLGSITEKIISLTREIPMLIIKKKDENLGFWKAFRQA